MTWQEQGTWERYDDATQWTQGVVDPWTKKDPWNSGLPGKRPPREEQPTIAPPEEFSGTYEDVWDASKLYIIVQQGADFSIKDEKGTWEDWGKINNGNCVQLWKLEGKYFDGAVKFNNGAEWKKVKTDAAQAESTTDAGAAIADGSWGGNWEQGQEEHQTDNKNCQDPWNPQQGSTATPVAAAGVFQGSTEPTAQQVMEDQVVTDEIQRRARWRDYSAYQEHYKNECILPGKSPDEVAADELRLFQQDKLAVEGIDFDLYDQVSCDITGPKSENIPVLKTFEELYEIFSEYMPMELMNNIRLCGYTRPTPVQKYAIPAALSGRDVMVCAQTGSGKTAAFLVPILASMMKHSRATGAMKEPFQGPCKPDTLVLSPTRELCVQIYDEALKFTHKTGYRCIRVYGQEPVKQQLGDVAKGADVCVATPGRLWDYVSNGVLEVTEVSTLVLDEADRMLEMQMEQSIRAVVEKHGMPSKEQRQTMMFSATFPNECQKMAADYLYEHIFVGVGDIGAACHTVKQRLVPVDPEDKYETLLDALHEWLSSRDKGERLLVFTNSKSQAKGLDEKLYEANIDTGALHGDLKQFERETNLEKFRKGEIDVLVATDVASRGLDISGVSHVINYDLPFDSNVYIQRIGRTGRIGHRGKATTFISVGKDGRWYDRPEVLKCLPGIMTDVPDWLQAKLHELQKCSWMEDSSGDTNWQGKAVDADGVTEVDAWAPTNTQTPWQ